MYGCAGFEYQADQHICHLKKGKIHQITSGRNGSKIISGKPNPKFQSKDIIECRQEWQKETIWYVHQFIYSLLTLITFFKSQP